MDVWVILLIIWVAVIVLSIIIEAFTYEMITLWFIPSAVPPLIMASVGNETIWLQITLFVVLSLVTIIACRPVLKRYLIKETIHTNITDSNIGKKVKLTSPVENGKSTIVVNGVTWTAVISPKCKLNEGDTVEIVGNESNFFTVKSVDKEEQ